MQWPFWGSGNPQTEASWAGHAVPGGGGVPPVHHLSAYESQTREISPPLFLLPSPNLPQGPA